MLPLWTLWKYIMMFSDPEPLFTVFPSIHREACTFVVSATNTQCPFCPPVSTPPIQHSAWTWDLLEGVGFVLS